MTEQVGHLEAVDVRSVWKHEALDFTPWILNNADRLSDALGINLELRASEHPIGSFTLDIIGVDLDSGHTVIVENQLERPDHGHLGQLLTYAGGTHPKTIVWISTEFREEHRAALDWLNEQTDEEVNFFGVQISAVRIGNSQPAALFEVVARPNAWEKQVRKSTESNVLTESQERYIRFWNEVFDVVKAKHPDWRSLMRKPVVKVSWVTFSSGLTGLWLAYGFVGPASDRDQCQGVKALRTELYFGSEDEQVNAERFQVALENRQRIEEAFGGPLSFEKLPDKKASRISAYMEGAAGDEQRWPEYIEWLIKTQERFRTAFIKSGVINEMASASRIPEGG